MKILQVVALAIAGALLSFTVVPATERPYTGLQHNIEHMAAFFLLGVLTSLAFNFRVSRLLLTGVAFTFVLECLQIPLSTRHARLEDFIVDTTAICAGIALARLRRTAT